jgi:hypothetical protein
MAGVYRVRTTLLGATGAPWLNTLWFDFTGGTAQQAATAAGAFWTTIKASQASAISFATEAAVSTISTLDGKPTAVTNTTPVTGVGAVGTDRIPPIVQALCRLRTGVFVGGREIRGRFFVPGLTEAASDATGNPTSTVLTAINGALTTLVGDANSILVVYSPTNFRIDPVVSADAWNQWATMRSRRD